MQTKLTCETPKFVQLRANREAEDRAIARPYTPGVEKLIEARKLLEAGADSATVFTGTTQIVYTQDDLPALRQKILYSM